MKQLIILGTGGNCTDILDTVNEINKISPQFNCIGFLDDNKAQHNKKFYDVPVLGDLSECTSYPDAFFVNGIGSERNFWMKQAIIEKTTIPFHRFVTIIHPTASVSAMATLGFGVVVFQQVTITSNVQMGNHVIILPNSVISHDVVIGDYTSITGGVCISGAVQIGDSCYIGTNSSLLGGITIGKHVLIGMGSNVLHSVEKNSVVIGNPAKVSRPLIKD